MKTTTLAAAGLAMAMSLAPFALVSANAACNTMSSGRTAAAEGNGHVDTAQANPAGNGHVDTAQANPAGNGHVDTAQANPAGNGHVDTASSDCK